MANNYLITGYWGEPHVTAENDRGINAAIFGKGRFVLPVGEQFRAEYIGNNTIRMYDGKLMNNGAAAGIPAGEYVDILISEAGQGMNRNDLIVFQYKKDASTLIERGAFVVVKGTETAGVAEDPALTHQDLLSNAANFDQMALWRVSVSATVISSPVKLFDVSKSLEHAGGDMVVEATSTDGANYAATIEGVEALYAGLGVIIIPNYESKSTSPKLNVNGLGSKLIRRRASNSTATTVASSVDDWMAANKPIRMMYDGACWIADFTRPNANDLYGVTPIAHGGTGADNAEEALVNLGAAPAIGSPVVAVTGSRNLEATDAGKFLRVDAKDTTTLTIYANTLPVGAELEVFRNTASTVRIEGAPDVYFALHGNSELSTSIFAINGQYGSIVLKQIDANVWSIQGAV